MPNVESDKQELPENRDLEINGTSGADSSRHPDIHRTDGLNMGDAKGPGIVDSCGGRGYGRGRK